MMGLSLLTQTVQDHACDLKGQLAACSQSEDPPMLVITFAPVGVKAGRAFRCLLILPFYRNTAKATRAKRGLSVIL